MRAAAWAMRRPTTWQSALAAGLATILALAGCASTPPASPPGPTTSLPAGGAVPDLGIIVSARGVPAPSPGHDWRAGVLRAIGSPIADAQAGQTATEFVIRADDGRTLSVVQPAEDRLRPGQRVTIIQGNRANGDRTRIAPAE